MSTKINSGALKALLRFAATKDVRYYLCGVLIEPAGYAVATDGRTLLAVRCEPFDGTAYIVPSATIKAALGLATKYTPEIEIDSKACGGVSYTPIDGRFPEWRRIVPTTFSGETAYIDPEYLVRAMAAWRDMGLEKTVIAVHYAMNGDGAAVQTHVDVPGAIIILMPVRIQAKGDAPPDHRAAVASFLVPRVVTAAA